MSLFLIGGIHGRIEKYLKVLSSLPPRSRSIALGDLYLGRPNVHLPVLPEGHRFLRGNHDSPELCKRHSGYVGDYGCLPDDGLFFLSGAQTASWRVLGNSKYWYRDEELPSEALEAAYALYESAKPSIVLSHEAPVEAAREILSGLEGSYFVAKEATLSSRTCLALQKMFDARRPATWYCGHYHVNREFVLRGTKFSCLAELITCRAS